MYLSRIKLDMSNRRTMKALTEPQMFHGAIEKAYTGPRQRTLWRLDKLGETTYLLLVSEEKMDLSAMAQQFGYGKEGWEAKDYSPLLSRVEVGSTWQFRLVANPVKRTSGNAEMHVRGKVMAHVTPEKQQQWLMQKAQDYGFSLQEDEFLAVSDQSFRFHKGGPGGALVTLKAVTFEGKLTVTDGELFRRTLTEGIGRGKAYGLGMLTVVQIRS